MSLLYQKVVFTFSSRFRLKRFASLWFAFYVKMYLFALKIRDFSFSLECRLHTLRASTYVCSGNLLYLGGSRKAVFNLAPKGEH
jgi:hypothetical protein